MSNDKTPEAIAREVLTRFDVWLDDKRDNLPDHGLEAQEWLINEYSNSLKSYGESERVKAIEQCAAVASIDWYWRADIVKNILALLDGEKKNGG